VVVTNKILGEDGPDGEIQTPYRALTLADDRVLEIDEANLPFSETFREERDTGSVEVAEV
jgi:hypothetical protein